MAKGKALGQDPLSWIKKTRGQEAPGPRPAPPKEEKQPERVQAPGRKPAPAKPAARAQPQMPRHIAEPGHPAAPSTPSPAPPAYGQTPTPSLPPFPLAATRRESYWPLVLVLMLIMLVVLLTGALGYWHLAERVGRLERVAAVQQARISHLEQPGTPDAGGGP